MKLRTLFIAAIAAFAFQAVPAMAQRPPSYISQPGYTTAVAASPADLNVVYTGNTGGAFNVVNPETGLVVGKRGHPGPIVEIAASKTGVTSVSKGSARLRALDGDIRTVVSFNADASSCAMNDLYALVGVHLVGSFAIRVSDGAVIQWFLSPGIQHPIVRFLGDGDKSFVMASRTGKVETWHIDQPQGPVGVLANFAKGVSKLEIDGRIMATISDDPNDKSYTLTNTYTGELIKNFSLETRPTALVFRPAVYRNGWQLQMLLAIGGQNGRVWYLSDTHNYAAIFNVASVPILDIGIAQPMTFGFRAVYGYGKKQIATHVP
jgi:hypothetical protein